MNKIIGLIPAAGKGTRLGLPFPKELYPVVVNDKIVPVATWALLQMIPVASTCVVVITPDKYQLIEYYRNGMMFGLMTTQFMIQESGEDLADAVRAAYAGICDYRVAFVMPDTIILPGDAIDQMDDQMTDEDDMVIGLFKVSDPSKFGMVAYFDGYATAVYDKPEKTDLEYAWGCLLWQPSFTELFFDMSRNFADNLNEIIKRGHTKVVVFDKPEHYYYDLGTVDGIKEYWRDELS